MNDIFLDDCLKYFPKIEDKSIDMILCDLPYGVTNRNKWDEIIDTDILWSEYNRIIKDNGAIVLTATQPFASLLISKNINMFRYDLIWQKNKATGHLNAKKMPLRSHESILVFYKNLPVYNPQKTTNHKPVNAYTQHTDSNNYGKVKMVSGGGSTDRYPQSILYFPVINNDSPEKFHPTQKPVSLFEYLIKTYTNEGDIVLDNCAGSGTTGIACLNTNRKYILIEKEEEYYSKMISRIENHKKELELNKTIEF